MPIGPEGRGRVDVVYADAPAQLTVFREALINVGALETVRGFATANFAFPTSVTIEAKTCGEPDAYWYQPERRLVLCYELVAGYMELAVRLGL